MQGHIRRRGKGGSYEYIIDIGAAQAQRCQGCGRRFWVERGRWKPARAALGRSRLAEERRRQTKAGFASRKEAQSALNKVLVGRGRAQLRGTQQGDTGAVPHRRVAAGHRVHGAPHHLPLLRAARRWHIAPHLGSRCHCSRSPEHRSTPSTQRLPARGRRGGTSGLSALDHPPRARRAAQSVEGCRALGRARPQPNRGGRSRRASRARAR